MIQLLALVATSSALLRSPATARVDRRAVLQTGGGMLAAATFAVPDPAFAAVESDPKKRFEAVRSSASASLSSTSKLKDKITDLELARGKDNFLFSAPTLCKSTKGGRFVSVRLWRPTGGETATEIVKGFGTRFSKLDKKPDGFAMYYGAVVRADEGEEFALFANVFETAEQAEGINTKELSIMKKKLIRANLQVILPVFTDSQLPAVLGGCAGGDA